MARTRFSIATAKTATIAALTTVAFSAATPAMSETFTFGSGVPERSSANSKGVFPALDQITEATDGRVSFNPIVGGQLVSLPNTLQGIRDGIVDSGYFITQFHAADLPYSSLMAELSGLGTDPYATMGALNEIFFVTCEKCREEFRETGMVPVLVQSASPLTMQCTMPVESAADLEGKKISVIGTPESRWADKLGMTPVRTRITDILPALQLGQTDCTLIGTAWIRSYGLEDTVKGVIEMPQGIITGAVPLVFGKGTWDKISADDRQAIVSLMPGIAWDYVNDAYVDMDAMVRDTLKDKVAFVPGDDAMKALWQDYQAEEVAALKDLAESRGLENGDALIDQMVEVMRAWHEDHLPAFQGDKDKYVALINDRVFSKYDF